MERPASGREDSIDAEVTAYRSAVAALVGRVEQRLEANALDADIGDGLRESVGAAIAEQLADLRREEIVGAAIVEERLKRDARAELIEPDLGLQPACQSGSLRHGACPLTHVVEIS